MTVWNVGVVTVVGEVTVSITLLRGITRVGIRAPIVVAGATLRGIKKCYQGRGMESFDQIAVGYRRALDCVNTVGPVGRWTKSLIKYVLERAWSGDEKAKQLLRCAQFLKAESGDPHRGDV